MSRGDASTAGSPPSCHRHGTWRHQQSRGGVLRSVVCCAIVTVRRARLRQADCFGVGCQTMESQSVRKEPAGAACKENLQKIPA